MTDKPPYRVPSMVEIRAIPWNGLKVASLFAGCGGSSLGYRMAGFRVAYANEFVPIAQDSYRANADPSTVVDGRDVKQVKPTDILKACGLRAGELDVLDGSPPCQAFSTAGKREKGWGKDREYEHGAKQRNEDLFFEYIRLRDGLKPRVFVAENVSGLVKGAAKGYFLEILAALKNGYRVVAPLLDAQWLGVPQARQRIVFIGVRDDLGTDPPVPAPLPYHYSVRDALPWLSGAKLITAGNERHTEAGRRPTWSADRLPSPTIMATAAGASYLIEGRKINNGDVVPENVGASIEGYAIEKEWDKLNPGQASDKYFNLVRPSADAPCPTITSAGVGVGDLYAPGGVASVTHPTEKRKFSILEVKRLCSFPDDFKLEGTYVQQWERLGNSVPPLMMRAVAETLRDKVLPAAPAAGTGRSSPPRRNRR